MNILCRYTLRNLKKNRVRTIVTIVGIILSVSMFTAVTTLVSSMHAFMVDMILEMEGDWHVAGFSLSREKGDSLKKDERVAASYALQNLGYARLEETANEYKPYLFVAGMEQGFETGMPVKLTSGRMPKNGAEILLPDHLATNGGIRYALGDELTLELGERTLLGERLTQQTGFQDGELGVAEAWSARESRTFTVVGTYARPSFEDFSAPGYTALTVAASGGADDFDVYLKLKNVQDAESFCIIELAGEIAGTNTDLLRMYGASGENAFNRVLHSLAAVFAGIIFVASISLIGNAFSISVSERTRQFGLLASIGATKKQLRASVMFEAAALSLIGIPLGLGAGMLGIGVTLRLLGPSFAAIMGTGSGATLHLAPSFAALAVAAALGLVTVLVSAWIPARRATGMPAIDAIRQTADINIKGREVKTSRLAYRLFGFPGMIARKNLKRSRRKYRATVFSLFLSIMLFISASSFSAYLRGSAEDLVDVRDFDLRYSLTQDEGVSKDELLSRLSAVSGVAQSSYFASKDAILRIPAERLEEEYRKYAQKYAETGDAAESFDVGVRVIYADPASYALLAAKSGVDAKTEGGIVVNSVRFFDPEEERFHLLRVLKSASGSLVAEDGAQYPILAEAESGPFGTGGDAAFMIVYPDSALEREKEELGTMFFFKAEDHAKAAEDMRKELAALSLSGELLIDFAEFSDTNRAMVTVINVFSYGFIVLISLIAAANVFNTISTNIGLRRREFAMLRSVGMTNREFSRMMHYECLMYGMKGLMYGLPVAVAVTWLIYRSVSEGYATGFFLPWHSVAIAVGSVFAVVFSTMVYSTRKLKGENTADALKNENL
ncbi:MAG: ABC transporter permease [Christensenellales bacterium]|jgi:putative ABC transport system permease protein